MDEQPNESQISKLLEELHNETDYIRRAAIDTIAELGLTDERLIETLKVMSANDPNSAVRSYARMALSRFNIENLDENPSAVLPSSDNIPLPLFVGHQQQIAGFIGWFLVASLLAPFSFGLLTFPGTLIALFLFARSKTSQGIAGGILIALGLNFVVSLVRGMTMNAMCFVPFYIDFAIL